MTTRASITTTTCKPSAVEQNRGGLRRAMRAFGLVALGLAGCVNPMYTRLPSFYSSNPQLESYEFQRQDPFPDPDIAPDGGSRPPDFQRPRTESRKAAEQRLFQGMRQLPQTIPRGAPLSGQRHPASVL